MVAHLAGGVLLIVGYASSAFSQFAQPFLRFRGASDFPFGHVLRQPFIDRSFGGQVIESTLLALINTHRSRVFSIVVIDARTDQGFFGDLLGHVHPFSRSALVHDELVKPIVIS